MQNLRCPFVRNLISIALCLFSFFIAEARSESFNPLLGETKFRGTVHRINSDLILHEDGSSNHYVLYSPDATTNETIDKLNSGDYITGLARLQVNNRLVLSSIEFVGLKDLNGYWRQGSQLFNFVSFSTFNVWKMDGLPLPAPENFQYSVMPQHGPSWKIFVSDRETVHFGNLTIEQNGFIKKAHMVLYSGKDGHLIGEYNLEKIKGAQAEESFFLALTLQPLFDSK